MNLISYERSLQKHTKKVKEIYVSKVLINFAVFFPIESISVLRSSINIILSAMSPFDSSNFFSFSTMERGINSSGAFGLSFLNFNSISSILFK